MWRWIGLVSVLVWAGGVLFLTRTIPIGLQTSEPTEGHVTAVAIYEDGHKMDIPVPVNGSHIMLIPRKACTFYFNLHGNESGTKFSIQEMILWGVPILNARQMASFQMREQLPMSLSPDGKTLVLTVTGTKPFDLPNAFGFIQRFMSHVLIALAILPVIIYSFVWFGYSFRHRIIRFLSRLDNAAGYLIAMLSSIVLTLPNPVYPVLPGLDPSWMWLLNKLAFTHSWGVETVFSYGPLGFLAVPQPGSYHVYLSLCANAIFLGVLCVVASLLFRAGKGTPARMTAWMIPLIMISPWPDGGVEWKWCFISIISVVYLVFTDTCKRSWRVSLLAFAAIAAVIQTLMKFSSFVAIVPTHGCLLMYGLIRSRGKWWRDMGVYAGVWILAVFLAIHFLFPSVSAFMAWCRGSYEITKGYNQYMIVVKSVVDITIPFLVAGFSLGVLLFRNPYKRSTLTYLLLFSFTLFCTFKYALIRQGAKPFTLLLGVIVAFMPLAVKNCVKRCFLLTCILLIGSVLLTFSYSHGDPLTGFSVDNVKATVSLGRSMEVARGKSTEALRDVRLPSTMLNRIGTNTVMVVGNDYGVAMASNLNLIPFPAFQLYCAYTEYLEDKCAEALESSYVSRTKTVARFLLVPATAVTIDSKNAYFDAPRLWMAVRRNYTLVEVGPKYLLLERRTIQTPTIDPLQILQMDVQPSFIGRLFSVLFRPTRILLDVSSPDGTSRTYAVNPLWAKRGNMPAVIPTSEEEVVAFLGGKAALKPITDVRLSAESPFYYRKLEVKLKSDGCF